MGRGTSKAGGGSSAGMDIRSKIAGNNIDLDYAVMKYNEYDKTNTGTAKDIDRLEMWGREINRLQQEREELSQKANQYNIQMSPRKDTNVRVNEGTIIEKETNALVEKLDKSRSSRTAQRILTALERKKRTTQTAIDNAMFNLRQGKKPDGWYDVPSLKRAMGNLNRAISKAKKKYGERL